MTYRVVMSQRADQQLEEAADWWAMNRSPQEAARWYVGFSEAILSLGTSPSRYSLARENDHVGFELRDLHYGLGQRHTHRALFTIRPDIVIVLAIRHVAQGDVAVDDLAVAPV